MFPDSYRAFNYPTFCWIAIPKQTIKIYIYKFTYRKSIPKEMFSEKMELKRQIKLKNFIYKMIKNSFELLICVYN